MCDSFQTSAIIAENLAFYVFETLAADVGVCLRTHALAHVRRPQPMYMGQWVTLVFYFPKIDFCSFKRYIFYFNTPQVNLIFDWALNWP